MKLERCRRTGSQSLIYHAKTYEIILAMKWKDNGNFKSGEQLSDVEPLGAIWTFL